MARHRGKKALYEVMSKGRLKLGYDKTLEHLHSRDTGKPVPASDRDSATPERKVQLWSRPKLLQLNDNRLEISIPYQLAIAIVK